MKSHLMPADRDLARLFPKQPFSIRHRLADHPLLTLERLIELANNIDRDRVEYSSGKLQPNQDIDQVPELALSIQDTITQIEECGAWMVIKNVETEPEYKAFIENCLEPLTASVAGTPDAMNDFQGFIFISSPETVTPFHLDAEQNFLVQVKGQKFIHVFDNEDRSLVSDREMEISPSNHRNRTYAKSFEERAEVFEMMPGDGVFVPYLWPHWVRTAKDYSISMAITWKTPRVHFNNRVLAANALLRKAGLPQSGPGRRPRWDWCKAQSYLLARNLIEPLRKSEWSRKVLRSILFGRKANYYYKA